MLKKQITNIDRQILIEKSDFISKNSTFFHENLNNSNIFNILKNILLNPAPLYQCNDIEELVSEIKKSKIKNIEELSYNYSFEVLFAIVNSIRHNLKISESSRINQIETLRLYVKYISIQTSGTINYSKQNMIILDKEKSESIIKEDNKLTKQRRNR